MVPFLYCIIIQAARETGALQAAKNKLEKQVEELTWRLQLEKRMRVCMAMIVLDLGSLTNVLDIGSFTNVLDLGSLTCEMVCCFLSINN